MGDTSATLDSMSVSGAPDYHYFLGWAYYDSNNNDALTFTSDIESSDTTYYAIWGYNENAMSVAVTTSGTTLPTSDTYDWYTGEINSGVVTYKKVSGTITSDVYVYYARYIFSFKIDLNGNGETYFYAGIVYNKDSNITYSQLNDSVLKSYEYTLSDVLNIYDGYYVALSTESVSYTYSSLSSTATAIIVTIYSDNTCSEFVAQLGIYGFKYTASGLFSYEKVESRTFIFSDSTNVLTSAGGTVTEDITLIYTF